MELTTGVETEQPTQAPVENNNSKKKKPQRWFLVERERAASGCALHAYRRGKKNNREIGGFVNKSLTQPLN